MPKRVENGKALADLEIQLSKYEGEDRIVSAKELLEESEALGYSPTLYATGIPSLDRFMGGGIEAGEVFVLTGLAGQGKTSFLASITSHLSSQTQVAWFQLEMKPIKFLRQLFSRLEILPNFFLPRNNADKNLAWLANRIIEAHVKYDCRVFMIDHLHEIISLDRIKNANASLEIGDIVAYLKDLAEQYGFAIFLIAHCVDDKMHPTHPPGMHSLRDSGMISRYADMVASIWSIPNSDLYNEKKLKEDKMHPTNETDDLAKMRLWKNRREGTKGFLILRNKNHLFTEVDLNQVDFSFAPKVQDSDDFDGL